jgi:hypothetical protein
MINFSFNISNPWSNRWDILWSNRKLIGKNKAVEFNGYRTNYIIDVDFNFRPVGDHGGVRLMLGLLGYDVELHFYDTRHWNYETNTWETHDGH